MTNYWIFVVNDWIDSSGKKWKGIIICKEKDEKMEYAFSATDGIIIKHYSVDFKLS